MRSWHRGNLRRALESHAAAGLRPSIRLYLAHGSAAADGAITQDEKREESVRRSARRGHEVGYRPAKKG